MGHRVNPDSSTAITKGKRRNERRLIPIWTFIREHQSSGEEEAEDDTTALTKSRLYLVGLGIFVALVAGPLIYMSIRTITALENISDLTAAKKELVIETKMMESKINSLNLEIDKKCGPCPDHWMHYMQKCYLFYEEPDPWKTWEESQTFCQDRLGRLVVIGNLEEQTFVGKNIKYYKSEHHGYWIGLQNVNNTWSWINGRADSLGFWMTQAPATVGPKVLVIPKKKPTESWKKANNEFQNKFICNPADCIESETTSSISCTR
ncbi:CD209 antigen-like protein E isoform X2 [Poecilia reticulata]|uniref:CD209 antigen-like protein E isoform X2 n=1 Tax=Poecilia reticulata TaxID=8081 RepID=UPI0004A3664F|nr:PREDICTED: CD209 antigen-like protein E isoform X2 [Poecilia reticulata]